LVSHRPHTANYFVVDVVVAMVEMQYQEISGYKGINANIRNNLHAADDMHHFS
jgi:hypothetical protein